MTTSEKLQSLFSGLVAISTVVYAYLTWKLVAETKKIRLVQHTPDLNVYLELSETDASFIFIVFKNFGLGIAKDVTFNIIKDFEFYDSSLEMLNSKGIIKDGISSFYPNQQFRYFFTDLSSNYQKKIDQTIYIEISYSDITGSRKSKISSLSISEVSGQSRFTPPETFIGRISYELTEIRKTLRQFQE